jgi:hypothetical protein
MKSATAFEPDDVRLMGRVCDEAWRILRTALVMPSQDYEKSVRGRMAGRVMAALEEGERDPGHLKAIALG